MNRVVGSKDEHGDEKASDTGCQGLSDPLTRLLLSCTCQVAWHPDTRMKPKLQELES